MAKIKLAKGDEVEFERGEIVLVSGRIKVDLVSDGSSIELNLKPGAAVIEVLDGDLKVISKKAEEPENGRD